MLWTTRRLEDPRSSYFQACDTGVPKMAQPKVHGIVTMRAWGHSLASFSRLRIQNCCDIFLGSLTKLWSCIAVILWSVVKFSCKPLGGWVCYCPCRADRNTEAQPGQYAWYHTLRNQVVKSELEPRPYIWKSLKLAIAIQWHLRWCLVRPQAFICLMFSHQGVWKPSSISIYTKFCRPTLQQMA